MKDFNFLHPNCDMEIASNLLDGWPAITGKFPVATGFKFKFFLPEWTMAHIMADIGMFSSVTQARKNGWDKPIPPGLFLKEFKKQGKSLAIVNIPMEVWNRGMLFDDEETS